MRSHKNGSGSFAKALSGPEQVEQYLEQLEHPLKSVIEEVRSVILSVNDQITEHVKWNAPSFCIQGKDRITFNFHGKEGFRLVFHCGSKKLAPGEKFPLITDETHLLDWVTSDRATVTIKSADHFEEVKSQLIKLAAQWMKTTENI